MRYEVQVTRVSSYIVDDSEARTDGWDVMDKFDAMDYVLENDLTPDIVETTDVVAHAIVTKPDDEEDRPCVCGCGVMRSVRTAAEEVL